MKISQGKRDRVPVSSLSDKSRYCKFANSPNWAGMAPGYTILSHNMQKSSHAIVLIGVPVSMLSSKPRFSKFDNSPNWAGMAPWVQKTQSKHAITKSYDLTEERKPIP